MKLIFDVGSNNGDDVAYYLLKADKVIAFEANPVLCARISDRFARECREGRVVVVNGEVCAERESQSASLSFYVHKEMDVLSQMSKPRAEQLSFFDVIEVPPVLLSEKIREFGMPDYVKIDIEGYDEVLLKSLFSEGLCPDYLSCEIHTARCLKTLLSNPQYIGFKLVSGQWVPEQYGDASIRQKDGSRVSYAFPKHFAGPCADDIDGPWLDRQSFISLVKTQRLGWKDAHASRVDKGQSVDVPVSVRDHVNFAKAVARPDAPKALRRLYSKALALKR